VLVVDRDLALAEATVEMITSEGGKAIAAAYDVTSSAQCSAMVADAVSRWGRLDCLDNNVGIGSTGTCCRGVGGELDRVMHVNVDTMFLACKHAIPAMVHTAGGGAHRECLFDLCATTARIDRLHCLQGRGYRSD